MALLSSRALAALLLPLGVGACGGQPVLSELPPSRGGAATVPRPPQRAEPAEVAAAAEIAPPFCTTLDATRWVRKGRGVPLMPIVSDDLPWGAVPGTLVDVLSGIDKAELEAGFGDGATVAWLGPVVPRATSLAAAGAAFDRAAQRFAEQPGQSRVSEARDRAFVQGKPPFISYERMVFSLKAPGNVKKALQLLRRPVSSRLHFGPHFGEGRWISLCSDDGPCSDPIASPVFEERVVAAMSEPGRFVFYRATAEQLRLETVEWVNPSLGGVAEFREEVERVRQQYDSNRCECPAPSPHAAAWSCGTSVGRLLAHADRDLMNALRDRASVDPSQLRRIVQEGLQQSEGLRDILRSDPPHFGNLRASIELAEPVAVTVRAKMLAPARQLVPAAMAKGLVANDSAQLARSVSQSLAPQLPRASKRLARFTLDSFRYRAGRSAKPVPSDAEEHQVGFPTLLFSHWPYLIAAQLPYPPDYRVVPVVWPRQLSRLTARVDDDDLIITLHWKRTDGAAKGAR